MGATLWQSVSAAERVEVGNEDLLCAWPIQTTPDKVNVAYPDANATYWTMPFFAEPGLEIRIEGNFPSARYFGLDVYGSDSLGFSVNGVDSTLADFEIQADAGGTNPWQNGGLGTGSYNITVSDVVAPGQPNVLPLAPTPAPPSLIPGLPDNTGYLMLRVYLPTGGDPDDQSQVSLPTLTFSGGSLNRPLTPCSEAQSDGGAFGPNGPLGQLIQERLLENDGGPCDQDDSCPPLLSFSRAGGATTPFPNGVSGYIAALYQPAAGYIGVVRAQMPSSSRAYGDGPAPWPEDGTDLRYWSFCNYLYQAPFPVIEVGNSSGCIADDQTPLVDGSATLVLSSVADRPEATLAEDSTLAWLPTSEINPTAKEVVAIRNMLPATTFQESVTNISNYKDAALAEQVMGVYYPQMTQCTLETFELAGVEGCFASPESPVSASDATSVPQIRSWLLLLVAPLLMRLMWPVLRRSPSPSGP